MGKRDADLFQQTVRLTGLWGWIGSMTLAVIYWLSAPKVLAFFTAHRDVLRLAEEYSDWIVFFPISAFWGLLLYGVFSGVTQTGPIRDSMIMAFLAFIFGLWVLVPSLGNHGLWCSFILFSLGRSLFLWLYLPKLERSFFSYDQSDSREAQTA